MRRSEIVIGGYLVVIANCPSCGTHYKHEQPIVPARGRCGRCDTSFDLGRLRPYRIVAAVEPTPAEMSRARQHLPIGLDDPALATTIARNVERTGSGDEVTAPALAPARDAWDSDDPLPPIPEMATLGAFEQSMPPPQETDILLDREIRSDLPAEAAPEFEVPAAEGRVMTFVLWLAAGGIVGTGASWTLGGGTLTGMVAGTLTGALIGWGWVRWTSPR